MGIHVTHLQKSIGPALEHHHHQHHQHYEALQNESACAALMYFGDILWGYFDCGKFWNVYFWFLLIQDQPGFDSVDNIDISPSNAFERFKGKSISSKGSFVFY